MITRGNLSDYGKYEILKVEDVSGWEQIEKEIDLRKGEFSVIWDKNSEMQREVNQK